MPGLAGICGLGKEKNTLSVCSCSKNFKQWNIITWEEFGQLSGYEKSYGAFNKELQQTAALNSCWWDVPLKKIIPSLALV